VTPDRGEIERRLLDWMREPEPADDDGRFEELALALFAHQFENCVPYARFCRGRGRTPGRVRSWRDIPPVPTGAFKEVVLRSFPPEHEVHVFCTSGTSGERRGELHLDTLAPYEASLIASFESGVLPDLKEPDARIRLLVLAPSPAEAPDSSLSHMFGVMLARRGDAASRYLVSGGALQVGDALAALEHASDADVPLALCGTAFAFVHLLEALADAGRQLQLPPASRVMETGGFKGRARERSRESLYAEIKTRLGVPEERIVNQYGMTELGSQFYDSVLREPGRPRRKCIPAWTRVRLIDPETGDDAGPDQPGMITILDLANTGSVLAVQTADLGLACLDGFEVLGRQPGAEERGCSIAADEMLGAGRL